MLARTMRLEIRICVSTFALAIALFCVGAVQCAPVPVNSLDRSPHVRSWFIAGPFPNPKLDETPDGITRAGFDHDYLAELGGESVATLALGAKIEFIDEEGNPQTAVIQQLDADKDNVVKLDEFFPTQEYKIAYAFAYVQSPGDQEMTCFLGSDDWAKVWVNGELVYSKWAGPGRECTPREDHFQVNLRKGVNNVLLKLDQGPGGWRFIFELVTNDEAAAIMAEQKRNRMLRDFRYTECGPEWDRYTFEPGPFPNIDWKESCLVEELWGELPLKERWFDADLNEVIMADKPGRYAVYVESTAPDGRVIRRAITCCCVETGLPFLPPIELPYPECETIDETVWNEQRDAIADFGTNLLAAKLNHSPEGAILLAGLCDLKPLGRKPTQLETPLMLHQDYQLALKRKLLGVQDTYPALKLPHKKTGAPAAVLHEDTAQEAGMKSGASERIREVCREWYEDSSEPFTVLVARRGVVVTHEAFGNPHELDDPLDNRYPLASITKTHAGLLFAQFMDQGLIDLDDPVGKYLPDFPTEGEQMVTLRNCFTHTTGLAGHGEWGGMDNPWLDNVIANGIELLNPGKVTTYNGMGFDLAGKVMEIVSGKSIFRLFHENFFIPLGQENPMIEDLGYGIDCTAEDLARVGQLMLNRGSYGDTEFFSPETFDRIMPQPFKDVFPDLPDSEWDYGLGIDWERNRHPDAGKNGMPDDQTILSKNTIGHGSATSCVLRVDLDNDLVVAVVRFTAGKDYGKHLTRLLQAVADGME